MIERNKEEKIDCNNERLIASPGGRWLKGAMNAGDLE